MKNIEIMHVIKGGKMDSDGRTNLWLTTDVQQVAKPVHLVFLVFFDPSVIEYSVSSNSRVSIFHLKASARLKSGI